MGSERREPEFLQEGDEQQPIEEVLEAVVDMFIYNNEFARASTAQRNLIALLERQGIKPGGQVLRLFRIHFAMGNIREAVTTAIKGIGYCLESGEYKGIVAAYLYLTSMGIKYYTERELTAYCYELCLSLLLDKEKKPAIDHLLIALAEQVPYFVKCSEYEKLKKKEFHLLCIEDDSYNQALLVPLIVEKYKQ
jgi:hypothetical protein